MYNSAVLEAGLIEIRNSTEKNIYINYRHCNLDCNVIIGGSSCVNWILKYR